MTSSQTFTKPQNVPDLDMLLRKLLREEIWRTGLSYDAVAQELTKATGRGISAAMIGNWVSEEKEAWHLPAYAVPAICSFLGTDAIQRALLDPTQRQDLELGRSLRRVGAILEKKCAQARELAKLLAKTENRKR